MPSAAFELAAFAPPGHPAAHLCLSYPGGLRAIDLPLPKGTPPAIVAEVERILAAWRGDPPSKPDPSWVKLTLRRFEHCYAPASNDQAASDAEVDPSRDPLLFADFHLGVRKVRKYFPSFVPSRADFQAGLGHKLSEDSGRL